MSARSTRSTRRTSTSSRSHPVFNLYNNDWPIYTAHEPLPPAKFVHADEGRLGHAIDSFVSSGAVVSGGQVERSILSPWVTVHSYAEVTGSVLMNNVVVGRNAIVRNAIVDKNVVIPEGARLGVDPEEDQRPGLRRLRGRHHRRRQGPARQPLTRSPRPALPDRRPDPPLPK